MPNPPGAYVASNTNPLCLPSKKRVVGGEPTILVSLDDDERFPCGIITSHDCDVDEEGRNRKPWVQVAPVYELKEDDKRIDDIRAWKFNYMAPISAFGPTWIGDLRLELPVEKSWLVLQPSTPAFRTPEEFLRFAELCGHQRSRPGIATAVTEQIVKPLQEWLEKSRQAKQPYHPILVGAVKEVFLDVRGDPLAPEVIQLIFLGDTRLPDEVSSALDGWWEENFAGRGFGFVVLANRYLDFASVSYAERRLWIQLPLSQLISD